MARVKAPTEKAPGAETAPPGFCTVTLAVPGAVRKLAATYPVSCVELLKTVGTGVPFHNTVDPAMKFWPVMVSWIPGPDALFPRAAYVFVQLVLCDEPEAARQTEVTEGPPMANFTDDDVAGPGFCTETLAVPADAISDESTRAYNCVALT